MKRKNCILTTQQEKEIIAKKQQGVSNLEIISEYKINKHLIYQILNRDGREKIIANKKYFVNQDYFEEIDTEEKAYWLGFLYADGYVRMHKGRSGELKLKLSIKDKAHIELFKKCINSTHQIKDISSEVINESGKKSSSLCSSFSVYNTKLVNDLFKQGCLNNKTYKLQFPFLNFSLERHFIRGYFDGDGCVSTHEYISYINKKGHKNINNINMIHFTSGSLPFLENIQKILFNKINTSCLKIGLYKKAYRIIWYSRDDITKIYSYLYKDSTIFLERKKK